MTKLVVMAVYVFLLSVICEPLDVLGRLAGQNHAIYMSFQIW